MSLIKIAITNPDQMHVYNWIKNNPNMGHEVAGKYDLVTNLAKSVKADPSKRGALIKAVGDLRASGLQKMNPEIRSTMPSLLSKIKPLAYGAKNLLARVV